MRLGAALFLIAVGAILKFAVHDAVKGIDLGVVGIILMIVGVVGLLAELAYSMTRRRTRVVHEERVAPVAPGDPYHRY